jgi:hypothetical protein
MTCSSSSLRSKELKYQVRWQKLAILHSVLIIQESKECYYKTTLCKIALEKYPIGFIIFTTEIDVH